METEKIRTGDVLLVSGDWKLADIIQDVTNSKWNHAGIMVWIWGELFVLEMERPGFIPTKFDSKKYCAGYPQDRRLAIMRSKVMMPEKDVAMFIIPKLGLTRYDFISLGFAQPVYNWLNVWLGRVGVGAGKRFYCSEICAYMINHFQPKLFAKWWRVSPGMLATEHVESFEIIPLNY